MGICVLNSFTFNTILYETVPFSKDGLPLVGELGNFGLENVWLFTVSFFYFSSSSIVESLFVLFFRKHASCNLQQILQIVQITYTRCFTKTTFLSIIRVWDLTESWKDQCSARSWPTKLSAALQQTKMRTN